MKEGIQMVSSDLSKKRCEQYLGYKCLSSDIRTRLFMFLVTFRGQKKKTHVEFKSRWLSWSNSYHDDLDW